ncbi:hypothetical protein Mapa_006985 [Marchantia paleacea]|nr:hypothetical protein Mapa_006985 [Marchantia paleacea]
MASDKAPECVNTPLEFNNGASSGSQGKMGSKFINDHDGKAQEEGAKADVTTISKVEPETATESATDSKWRAVSRIQTDVPAENLWAVAKDYCNLDWCSVVTGCVLLEGEAPGTTVGTVRHCTNDNVPWYSDEKLIAIDHEKLTLTYAMVDSSLGWIDYRATLSIGRDQDGKSIVELKGEQGPRDTATEEEAVQFMTRSYSLLVSELESRARTL